MIVVSDTSPLTALLSVGEEKILPRLFGRVIVPCAVQEELLRGHAAWPEWLQVREVADPSAVLRFSLTVDEGEAEAIELAKELRADLLLIDERKGRRLASAEGVPVIGLLGVVVLAKRSGLIPSARELIAQLRSRAGFYLSGELVDRALASIGE
jgi:predicted nucleic acid-binding protein